MKDSCKFAVIGGSGGFSFLNGELGKKTGKKIVNTPFGRSAPIHFYKTKDFNFAFLSRHGETGYEISAPFVNYRANIWALKEIGSERIISWTGPGIINTKFEVGDYVLPDDLIDETRVRKYTFFEKRGLGFIRQNPVFCNNLKTVAQSVLEKSKERFHSKGTYVCTEGPRLETPAEIRKFKMLGGDLVGMTLIPECFLAKELEMCYLPICYLTNYAEGVKKNRYEKGILFEGMQREAEKRRVDKAHRNLPKIIMLVIKKILSQQRNCSCKDSMLRYKKAGIIGGNWREWVG